MSCIFRDFLLENRVDEHMVSKKRAAYDVCAALKQRLEPTSEDVEILKKKYDIVKTVLGLSFYLLDCWMSMMLLPT